MTSRTAKKPALKLCLGCSLFGPMGGEFVEAEALFDGDQVEGRGGICGPAEGGGARVSMGLV